MRAIMVTNQALSVAGTQGPQAGFLQHPEIKKYINNLIGDSPAMVSFNTWKELPKEFAPPVFLCLRSSMTRMQHDESAESFLKRFYEQAKLNETTVKRPDLILTADHAKTVIDQAKNKGKLKEDPWFLGAGKTFEKFLDNMHTVQLVYASGCEPTPERLNLKLFEGFEMRQVEEIDSIVVETWQRPYVS